MDRFSRDTHYSAPNAGNTHFHSYNHKNSIAHSTGANHHANAHTAHTNAANTYSAVASNDHTKDECTSTPYRNYNNFVKKAMVQSAIDTVAAKLIAADAQAAKQSAESPNSNANSPNSGNNSTSNSKEGNTNITISNGSFGGGGFLGAPHSPAPPPYSKSPGGSTINGQRLYAGPNGKGITVLDLASGRGGDVGKWIFGQSPCFAKLIGQHTNDPSKFICVKKYVAVDIASGAVETAQQRYAESKGQSDERLMKLRHHTPLADGSFFVSNCLVGTFFDDSLKLTPPAPLNGSFNGNTSGQSPMDRPRKASQGPTLPTYNDAIAQQAATHGIGNRSNPSTPQHRAVPSPNNTSAPRATGLERFGGVSPSGLVGATAPPPPFVALPPSLPTNITTVGEALSLSHVDEVNIVSIQFAFHYACFSKDNLSKVLKGIASLLKRNGCGAGIALITTVDAKELSKRLIKAYNEQLPGKATVEYSSKLFTITAATDVVEAAVHEDLARNSNEAGFVDPAACNICLPLGTMYKFKLESLVDCEEFVIPSDVLIAAAEAEGLKLASSKPFNHWMGEFSSNKKVKQQLGEGDITTGDLDLIDLYRSYVFEV